MTEKLDLLDRLEADIGNSVVEDPEKGIYRVRRDIFTDPRYFELEMKHIFEGNWIFLAHESQIPNSGDYFTLSMGRQPVVIVRDKEGELHAFINACSHRGALLCRRKKGSKSGTLTCPFHGWTFSFQGKLLKAKDQKVGEYPDSFNQNGSHDLTPVARFESYRGFLFGSLNPEVMPLSKYLGDTREIIDQIVNQAPDGIEVLRGHSSYTYNGNWKMQSENGVDGYHVTTVHWSYASTVARRKSEQATKAVDAKGWAQQGGTYCFDGGHMMIWTRLLNPEVRPVYSRKAELEALYPNRPEHVDQIVHHTRNLFLQPNVYLMDQFSTQIRVTRPISVDQTEITIYCYGPKGEPADKRALRIRQYEDFFNVSGMGTPDDLEEFRACQTAYQATAARWSDMSRGAKVQVDGPDEQAMVVKMNPNLSGSDPGFEGMMLRHHKHWAELMLGAIEKERLALAARNQEDVA